MRQDRRARRGGVVPRRLTRLGGLLLSAAIGGTLVHAGLDQRSPITINRGGLPFVCQLPLFHPEVRVGAEDSRWKHGADLSCAWLIQTSAIGPSGRASGQSRAFYQLLATPDSEEHATRLLHEASTLEGQIYGACALAVLDNREAARFFRALSDDQMITTQQGCSLGVNRADALLQPDWETYTAVSTNYPPPTEHDPYSHHEPLRSW